MTGDLTGDLTGDFGVTGVSTAAGGGFFLPKRPIRCSLTPPHTARGGTRS